MLSRVNQLIFGNTGASTDFGQIGSEAAGTVVRTKDLTLIQALSEYQEGLATITSSADDPPNLEDINSLYFLITSQLAYLFQEGIPAWHTNAEYFVGSLVKMSDKVYRSKTGTTGTPNTGNDPTTDTNNWEIYLLNRISGGTAGNLVSRNAAGEVVDAGIVNPGQNLRTTDNPTFGALTVGTINTGQGATEVYHMNQNVRNDSAVTFASASLGAISGQAVTNLDNRYLPIGTTYIQFPGDSSPSALNLPGTWTNVSSELAGDFIRFEGGNASTFESGTQLDAMQDHKWRFRSNNGTGAAGTSLYASDTATSSNAPNAVSTNSIDAALENNGQGTPRMAAETRPRNKTVRKWRRTA